MPVSWTAENHQRLLLCVLNRVTIDKASIAESWAELFGHEGGSQPTAGAITEHLKKLKANLKTGSSKKPATTARSKVKSEKSNNTSKTPSKKRGRAISDDDDNDDDDDEDDEANIKEESTLPRTPESIKPREKLARTSKAGRTFTQYNDDDDDDDDDEDMRAYFDARNGNDTSPTPGSGKSSEFLEADDMSDVSEYTPDVE